MLFIVPGEKRLIAELEEFSIPYVAEPMDIGDIQVRSKDADGEYTIVELIIERKEGKDLAASILDGRYEEQKTRIFKALTDTNKGPNSVYYLVENFPNAEGRYDYGTKARARMWSAIVNTSVRDKFHVFQSKSISESAEFLIALDRSALKFKNTIDEPECTAAREMKVTDTALKKKKVTPDDFFIHSLMLIKGMQEDSAGAIAKEYPTFTALIKQYKSMIKNGEKAELLFKDTFRLSGKRKIGPVMSKKVFAFFSPETGAVPAMGALHAPITPQRGGRATRA
jgi:ERCC4-type nuclease